MEINNADFIALLNYFDSATAIVDSENKLLYANQAFLEYDKNIQQQIIQINDTQLNSRYLVRSEKLGNNRAIIVGNHQKTLQESDILLSNMLEKLSVCDNIFEATVQAIHEVTGWRWIFVTKFIDQLQVEVLAFWDTDKLVSAGSYLLPETPCEVMVRNKKFTLFTDVALSFPNNELLQQLGAKSYAGLVYYGKGSQPIGHIMAMHEHTDVDYQHLEDVIKLATLAVSSNLILAYTQTELKLVQSQVDIDDLTQLYNRRAFQDQALKITDLYSNDQTDSCIAIIDLDNLKQFNDKFGHPKGDHLLRLFATELSKVGRIEDKAFRIGGDEFALIMPHVSLKIASRFNKQIIQIEQRISLMLGQPVSVSVGFAAISEVKGDNEKCYALADQRMYADKAAKKS